MGSKIDKSIFDRTTRVTPGEPENKSEVEEETMSAEKSGTAIGSTVIKEVLDLVDAAKAGRLDTRADLKEATGGERELLNGINELLDAVIGPLNVAAEYVDRISKGDLPE
ncbi:MAG: hypothetical protein KOO61_00415, partial [Spirochaetales bacterium]|nr:hypothetical protein [Spirochaetales bacterium]